MRFYLYLPFKAHTLYKRNAGLSSKDEHLTSNELYGKLEVYASKSCTAHILAVEKTYRYIKKMMRIKLAYYRKEDWKRFIKIIDDRERIHDTWNEWHKAFLKIKGDLISQGFEVADIEIDLNELINYCEMKGIKNDGKARSQFVQTK